MKNLILILAIAFVAMFASVRAEEEILWKQYASLLVNGDEEQKPGAIYNAIFTPDDKYIIVSCNQKTIIIESLTGKYVRDLKDVAGVIRFSNDGKYIYTYDNRKINFETGEVVGTFTNKGEKLPRFTKMDVSERSGILLGLIYNNDHFNWRKDIYVFDLKTFELIDKLGESANFYMDLTVAQNTDLFVTMSEVVIDPTNQGEKQYTINLWDSKLRKIKTQYIGVSNDFATSLDGKWISSVNTGDILTFDAQTLERKWKVKQSKYGVLTGVTISPESRFVATGGAGSEDDVNDIHIWDLETGKLSYRYSNGRKLIWTQNYLSFSNDGKHILGWSDAGIAIFNAYYSSTKVDPIISNDTLQVFPNPSSKQIAIEINDNLNYSLKVVNQVGKEFPVISNLENSKLEIEVTNLENGVYYIVLTQDNVSKLYKFIKE